MKVVTADEMRSIDRKTIGEYGITGSVLMERAGLSVANNIKEIFNKKKVLVLSGGGNNGGDGLVAARTLFKWGWDVKVLMMSKKDKLSPDCLEQFKTAERICVPVEVRTSLTEKDINGSVIVDALLGTGINKPVTSPISDVIEILNKSDVQVVSVDIPSGISSDNAQVMGEAVRADYTVTFGLPKIGHLIHPGAEFSGKLFIEDIGFPEELLESDKLKTQTIENTDASILVPERTKYSHKGDYGHVLVLAGSRGKTGAAFMAARSCLRTGAGMVTIGVPESLSDIFQERVIEEMVLPLADSGNGTLSVKAFSDIIKFLTEKADLLAIGPGLALSTDITNLLKKLLKTATVPMILDADAINSLSGDKNIFKNVKAPVILTPHPGEMARLLTQKSKVRSKKSDEKIRIKIKNDKINTAISFAKETGVYLVLKGAPTIISEPDGKVYINTTGNPGMATAGSGDVLTGMIAGFLAQGLNPLDASILGTYMHGLAGDSAASEKGMHSLIASDIIDKIPSAFFSLKSNEL
jgi:NAD(P)H-hydrate epimerase